MIKSNPFQKFLLIFVALFVIGISKNGHVFSSSTTVRASEFRESEMGLLQPLLDCEDEESLRLIHPFQDKLEDLVKNKIGAKCSHISIYYRDLKNGPWYGIGQDELFSTASLMKVPIMMAILSIAKYNPNYLLQEIKFDLGTDQNKNLFIVAPVKLVRGQSYSINELVRNMIVYSDNNALLALKNSLPTDIFYKAYADLGVKIPEGKEVQDLTMSVKEYASFFRILFNATYLGKAMSQKALKLLTEVNFKDGIVAGVPSNIVVAHKFGERSIFKGTSKKTGDYQFHECGIIYYPNRPYILAVMTRGQDFKYLISVIRDVSKLVYEEIDSQMKR